MSAPDIESMVCQLDDLLDGPRAFFDGIALGQEAVPALARFVADPEGARVRWASWRLVHRLDARSQGAG